MLNVLAADLGASSGRVMRAAFNGNTLSLQEVRRFPNSPVHIFDRMYWNVYSLLQDIKQGIADMVRTHGRIESVAIDSWAVDFGLLDADGHLLDLPRHYRDRRNLQAMNEVINQLGKDYLFARTGIQLNPINSLYQLYALKRYNKPLLDTADSLLMIPDLLNFFLTGQRSAEFTNATSTQFLRPSGTWDIDLLTAIDLPHELLPAIKQPGTVMGTLRDQELLNSATLASTKVVHTASHDTAAAVLSVPHNGSDYVYISSGTWSLMGTVVDIPIITDMTRQFNFTNEGGVGNYRLLKNVMGLWLVQETQRALQLAGEPYDIERLVHRAKLARPFTFLFNPDDARLLQPTNMPEAISEICRDTGQQQPADSGCLLRGIFESLALKYRRVLEQLEMVTGHRYDQIHIVGGGSQNQLLSQFTADATGRTVVTGPVEASAMGNVLGQLLALGEITSTSEMAELVRQSVEQASYTPRETERWDEAYENFNRISKRQEEQSESIQI